jgi:hypothetical protein
LPNGPRAEGGRRSARMGPRYGMAGALAFGYRDSSSRPAPESAVGISGRDERPVWHTVGSPPNHLGESSPVPRRGGVWTGTGGPPGRTRPTPAAWPPHAGPAAGRT